MNSKRIIRIVCLLLLSAGFSACRQQKVYHHYEHTPLNGWEKNDTLIYDVSPQRSDCVLREEVGLRIDSRYPFQKLCLVLEQVILPSHTIRHDTLFCELFNKHGQMKGSGINYYQYSFHLTDLPLSRGDSLHISLRHNMKREILTGIVDIGILLEKY